MLVGTSQGSKRVECAQAWISWLMGALIGSQACPGWLPKMAGRILLVDASRLKIPAGSGDDVRLHCAYDLQAGRLVQVEVTDRHSAEGVHHFSLCKGDVVVTDAGYQLGTCVQLEQQQEAFGVHRFSPRSVAPGARRWEENRSKATRSGHQKYGTISEYKVWVWDAKHQKRFPVRLVISLLPRKQAMAARARKQERIRNKKGTKANLAPAWWAGVMLIGTTLPLETWSAQDVVKLYRERLANRTVLQTSQRRAAIASGAGEAVGASKGVCASLFARLVLPRTRSSSSLGDAVRTLE